MIIYLFLFFFGSKRGGDYGKKFFFFFFFLIHGKKFWKNLTFEWRELRRILMRMLFESVGKKPKALKSHIK